MLFFFILNELMSSFSSVSIFELSRSISENFLFKYLKLFVGGSSNLFIKTFNTKFGYLFFLKLLGPNTGLLRKVSLVRIFEIRIFLDLIKLLLLFKNEDVLR